MFNYIFARFIYNRLIHGGDKNQDQMITVFGKIINPSFIKVIEPLIWYLLQARIHKSNGIFNNKGNELQYILSNGVYKRLDRYTDSRPDTPPDGSKYNY